jgi:tetratricopeptide (TPR) repeat protein
LTSREFLEALTKAYELRERTSLPERLEIEARYHEGVTGDYDKTIEVLEGMRRAYPRSSYARLELASTYAAVGRYDDALTEALAAFRLEPDGGPEHTALAQSYIHLNRFDEAKTIATAAIVKKVDSPMVHAILVDCALVAGDRASMDRELAWAASNANAEMLVLQFQVENAIYAGKLREVVSLLQRREAVAREQGDQEEVASVRLTRAYFEALYGRRAAAVALVRDVLSRPTSSQNRLRAAIFLALAGATAQAATVVEQHEPETGLRADAWPDGRQIVLAIIENEGGHPDRALERLQPLVPRELGMVYGFLPVIIRGEAYLRARNGAAAIAEFEKVFAHRGLDPSSEMIAVARLGIARGHRLTGNVAASRAAYQTLLAQLHDADPDLPLLLEARREYAALPK